MADTWVCLLPFLIVIPVAMLTKQVQPGLFVALLLGSYLMYPTLLGGPEHMIQYLISNVVVINNIRIILFLYAFAGLIGMIKYTGGIKGFVHLVSQKVKTKRGAMLLTWISTIGTFSEPDFRIVTVGPIMKALKNRLNMSKKRIGYAIEFTANPVIAIIPIATAFVGYMVSVIGQAMDAAGVQGTPYVTYVKSIPFNFFSFVIILVGIYYSFIKKPKENEDETFSNAETKGKASKKSDTNSVEIPTEISNPEVSQTQPGDVQPNMQKNTQPSDGGGNGYSDIHGGSTGMYESQTYAQQKEDQNLQNNDQSDTPPHADQQEDIEESHRAYTKGTPKRAWNLVIPIVLFLLMTLFLSWWDGHSKADGFFNAFINSDMLGVMLTSLLTAVIIALAYFMFQRFAISKLVTHFVKGGNELMNVIVMLSLIWGVTAVSEDLGFSDYITAHVQGWIPNLFIAPVLFMLGAVISYFIGSSWGTWGLLMPLGVTLAAQSGTSVLLVIGAVFASGTFGAFTSPLSDNTVTLCTVLDLPVIKYARSKLIPASIAAGITTILFGAASFFMG